MPRFLAATSKYAFVMNCTLFDDERFTTAYASEGQPALHPWQLALVRVLQFADYLRDRQAAEAVRARIDWKYALGLELTGEGFH
jgi:transposase